MPRDWIGSFANRERYNLSLLRRIAHRADVFLSAAAVRLAEVSDRPCILLRRQRAPSRWVVIDQEAVPREYAVGVQATRRPQQNSMPFRVGVIYGETSPSKLTVSLSSAVRMWIGAAPPASCSSHP